MSYLLGQFHAEEEIPPENRKKLNAADEDEKILAKVDGIDIKNKKIPFTEAIDFLKSKVPMTKAEWAALDQKLRFRAFTMAKLGTATEIDKAKQVLISSLENGETYAESWEALKHKVNTNALEIKPGYWETVFRTNTQSAYTAGKLEKYADTGAVAYQLMVVEDERTSKICRHLLTESGYGAILPVGHRFWQKYGFPPYHFNCRTSVCPIYSSQVAKTGYIVEVIPMNRFAKFKPQKGFGGNPLDKESWWKMTDSMIENAEKFGIMADIVSFAHKLGMKSYFPELLKDFETVYKNKKGGYVQKAKNWKYSEHEMFVAEKLFEDNHQIYLLPRTNKSKSPDMIIDGELGDIKECSSLTSVDSQLRDAIHQGCTEAALDVTENLSKKQIRETVQHRLERTKNKMKRIFILQNGRIFKI